MGLLSERALINLIRQRQGETAAGLVRGIGDDCAVFEATGSGRWLISVDTLVDGVHFDRRWHPPELLGRKCAAVNLSDIAAMGGVPRFLLLSLCLPVTLEEQWLQDWLSGVRSLLAEYGCTLIGGDTVRGRELVISVTVLGEAEGGRVLYRNGARAGDQIYVSGPLGSAAAGLSLFQWQTANPTADAAPLAGWHPLLQAHLNPIPRVALGQFLNQSGMVTAMQDISDGLATDLAHICAESGVGGLVLADHLPALAELSPAADFLGSNLLDWQLKGGEDYELLFTVRAGEEQNLEALALASGFEVYRVGVIREQPGVFVEKNGLRSEITFQGYEH